MNQNSRCPAISALRFELDRQGTLHIDGKIYSTGLFHVAAGSGVYQQSIDYNPSIPSGSEIVLMADDGERFEVAQIYPCKTGEHHHHFIVEE